MNLIPSEFAVGGVYFPPMLIAALLGLVLAWLTSHLLNRFRLSRFFFYPPLVLLALVVIYTLFIGTFVIPS
jgi:predicted membrane channel-forming protein YqfA (hemolysin III family)